jgi:hypothetical protein
MTPIVLMWLFGLCGSGVCASFVYSWINRNAALTELAAAIDRAAKLKDEFMTYKVHVSDTFASMAYVADIERRTVSALNDIKATQKVQDQKLDRLIERGSK